MIVSVDRSMSTRRRRPPSLHHQGNLDTRSAEERAGSFTSALRCWRGMHEGAQLGRCHSMSAWWRLSWQLGTGR